MTASKVLMMAPQSGAILAVVLLLAMLEVLPIIMATTTVNTALLHNVRSHLIGRINSNRSTECQCLLSTVSPYHLLNLCKVCLKTHANEHSNLPENGYNGNPGWNNGNNGGSKPLNQNNMLTRTWTDASGHRKSPSMWNDDSKSINGLFYLICLFI